MSRVHLTFKRSSPLDCATITALGPRETEVQGQRLRRLPPQSYEAMTIWHLSPAAQSPSPMQYLRQARGVPMHPVPFPHAIGAAEHAVPGAAPPLSGGRRRRRWFPRRRPRISRRPRNSARRGRSRWRRSPGWGRRDWRPGGRQRRRPTAPRRFLRRSRSPDWLSRKAARRPEVTYSSIACALSAGPRSHVTSVRRRQRRCRRMCAREVATCEHRAAH